MLAECRCKRLNRKEARIMINENLFLEAAEYAGFTFEFANSKLEAYLDTRGDSADVENFVSWLELQKNLP